MKQNPAKMDTKLMVAASHLAQSRVERWIEQAQKVQEDKNKESRLEARLCKACFYSPRLGGAAITSRPCMCCGAEMVYSSTATDVLCLECAKNHSLCKHCGGDVEMRTQRENWPKAVIGE